MPPRRPVAQKSQASAQPTCELTQSVYFAVGSASSAGRLAGAPSLLERARVRRDRAAGSAPPRSAWPSGCGRGTSRSRRRRGGARGSPARATSRRPRQRARRRLREARARAPTAEVATRRAVAVNAREDPRRRRRAPRRAAPARRRSRRGRGCAGSARRAEATTTRRLQHGETANQRRAGQPAMQAVRQSRSSGARFRPAACRARRRASRGARGAP